jgi:hypothetical protein
MFPFPSRITSLEVGAMDLAQVILYAGWIFFAAWGAVLAAASVIAFRQDIQTFTNQTTHEDGHPRAAGND